MATALAKKAYQDNKIAKDDGHYDQLANDPTIPQFPQGTTYMSQQGSFNGYPYYNSGNYNGTTNNAGNVGTSNVNTSNGNTPVLTGAGSNAGVGGETLVTNSNEDWINKRWRPAMGWMYMLVCVMDFVMFPIGWSLLQAMTHGNVTDQWQPVTLQGAGLFHMAMGAVLGIAAYGRTKEKVAGTPQ